MAKKQLNDKEKNVAKLLASGLAVEDVVTESGISMSTIYKWKRREDFKEFLDECIAANEALERRAKLFVENPSTVVGTHIDEQWLHRQTKPLIEAMFGAVATAVREINPEKLKELNLRTLPSLITALLSLVESYRTGQDRLAGMEEIIHEFQKLEQIRTKKVVELNTPGSSKSNKTA